MFHRIPIIQLSLLLFALTSLASAQEVVLRQVISREHPDFDPARAMLSVGRDEKVYLGSVGPGNTGYAIRTLLDGRERFGGSVAYALNGVAANKDGVLATANGHFAHKVTLYNSQFQQTAEVTDFLVSDAVGYDAPAHVEVGASGDFYGLDKHRARILRISADGKVLKAYS